MHDSKHQGLGKKSDKQLYLPKIRFGAQRAGQQRQNNPRQRISYKHKSKKNKRKIEIESA